MAYGEARAWWADVQHLHDDYEPVEAVRYRAGGADPVARARRTIEIRGRTVPAPPIPSSRTLPADHRRARPAVQRIGARPDRMALWALLMGLVLILVAVGTADAATVASVAGH